MPHLLISAAHKSSGKTMITAGLCRALSQRGTTVQPFKKGPDYIDPMWLSAAADRPCINLDYNTMSETDIRSVFDHYGADADLSIIEGNKGLYDGLDLDGGNSNAALAELLGAPVVLVINARGMTRGVAPLILGYQAFDPNIRIAGVILNSVGGQRHESKLRAILEHYTDATVLGAVQHDAKLEIGERHLGLVPSGETGDAAVRIEAIAAAISDQVDLDRLIAAAATARPVEARHPTTRQMNQAPDMRIAVARDSAFCFYYPDDITALEAAGAEIVAIDTLRDPHLPEVDGLIIGGGFPETHMAELEANVELRGEIRDAIELGLPAYAECGGLMYLARSLSWQGDTCEMAGALPGDVVMHDRPRGRGYVRLRETGRFPWPGAQSVDGGREIPAHEFHYSEIRNLASDTVFAYDVLRGAGVDGRHDGIVYRNLLASYAHLRNLGGTGWAERFVGFARDCKRQRAHMSRIGGAPAAGRTEFRVERASSKAETRAFIVGAGPGDPELLTVKAHRLLQAADAVIYDRLVSPQILDLIPAGATRIFAGKASRKHFMPQQEINELLLSLAKSGRNVVRLKGGDPFVFGRGSEEAMYLVENGISFEVVPGISASAGCAAYAGIPLTHRGLAKGVRFITGHMRDDTALDFDWDALADPDTTLVIYMGLTNVKLISRKLIEAGLPGYMPAAAIENGTTPEQRTVLTTLADLPDCVADMRFKAPTLLVIGEVAALTNKLSWHLPTVDCEMAAG